MSTFATVNIGHGRPAYIICEIAQAHDGSLGIAHSMIDAAADAGVDAVKFQTHIASEESTYDDRFRENFSTIDKTRYDYWKRMEFTAEQWLELAIHARKRNLEFISSPFSIAAVDMLEKIGVRIWKLGSGELDNLNLIQRILETRLPIIASTGLHPWAEITKLVNTVALRSNELALLQCTTLYPCPIKEVGVNLMLEIRERYKCIVGLSDHSAKLSPSLYAICNGADIIEVHGTFDRGLFGPDSTSSLTFAELGELVKYRDDFFILATNLVDKDTSVERRAESRRLFSRSLATKTDLKAGHIMQFNDFSFKKPGGGIDPKKISEYVGRRISQDVNSNYLLKESDFES